ncbi:MAG: ABC transporter permease subunit, partial [Elusimicrobia bacterium]|nr:ABC transporter permease subunit [Elusimicrobiota bacterium]
LSPAQEIRVILDLGTAAIEMFAFLSATFIAVRMIIREMEEKTVYLILSRPVSRATYLLGRFFGIISVIASYIIIMALSLTLMLLLKGWAWDSYILLISFTVLLKIVIITSCSILLSLISTSSASAFVSIFFLWALGHFSGELKYLNQLLKESGIALTSLLKFLYYVIPNFSFLNYKDTFHISDAGLNAYFYPAGYAIFYSAVIITLSIILFKKKEL